MDRASFERMVGRLDPRLVSPGLDADLLEQRRLFELGEWRTEVEAPDNEIETKAVGLINGQTVSASTVRELMQQTENDRENSVLYFEVVNRRSWFEPYDD